MRRSVLLLTVGMLLISLVVRAEQEPADDLNIKKVLLPPDRLAEELERVRQGVLQKMPLNDLDQKVRRYRETPPSAPVPRLVQVKYHKARLHESPQRRG